MRSQREILRMMESPDSDDFFGTIRGDLVFALEYAHAKSSLKGGVTKEDWEASKSRLRCDDDVLNKMREYMSFAWEKANDKRGLSASRSMSHYYAWLWLIGQDSLAESTRDYEFYGKPQLVEICKFLGINHLAYDDGAREKS